MALLALRELGWDTGLLSGWDLGNWTVWVQNHHFSALHVDIFLLPVKQQLLWAALEFESCGWLQWAQLRGCEARLDGAQQPALVKGATALLISALLLLILQSMGKFWFILHKRIGLFSQTYIGDTFQKLALQCRINRSKHYFSFLFNPKYGGILYFHWYFIPNINKSKKQTNFKNLLQNDKVIFCPTLWGTSAQTLREPVSTL